MALPVDKLTILTSCMGVSDNGYTHNNCDFRQEIEGLEMGFMKEFPLLS